MLTTLGALDVSKYKSDSEETTMFSADPDHNFHAQAGPCSDGEYELLDYILVSEKHRRPVEDESDAWVTQLKSKIPYQHAGQVVHDLSDHFPMWGKLVWDASSEPTGLAESQGPTSGQELDIDHSETINPIVVEV